MEETNQHAAKKNINSTSAVADLETFNVVLILTIFFSPLFSFKNTYVFGGNNDFKLSIVNGWSRADLKSAYQFWGHLIWAPKFKKVRKRKTNFFHKNKKLPYVTFFSKLNIESEHITTVNRTKKLSEYSNLFMFPSMLR